MSFENSDYRLETIDLENPFDVKFAHNFLSPLGFDYKPDEVEYTVILHNLNDNIIGTGSFSKNILKFVAVQPEYRSSTAFADIVTHLNEQLLTKYQKIFVYTKPLNLPAFEGLGFKEIATAQPIYSVLEFGFKTIDDYKKYLLSRKKSVQSNNIAAVVMNCNPFTVGHKYLVERAAEENDIVYLFVVEEDKSVFPFEIRWKLVERGVAHMKNVIMIKGGDYIVSAATFPSYFLKNENVGTITKKQTELDILVFGKHIAPVLGIKKRYVGTENYCQTTASYNETMKQVLPDYDIELVEIHRKSITGDDYISASKVRKAIKEDRIKEMFPYLPVTTLEYLLSSESAEIRKKIKESSGRH
ncbi:MAG: [citrate (pro-3S)-lyase] ligase [Marinilabiliales bacterium]|nr:MAG: [citrate (pro-3S)-lyase] ligase [Marinilabiliales bacterium]